MNNKRVALRYLKLIFTITLIIAGYTLVSIKYSFNFFDRDTQVATKKLSAEELKKQKQTNTRIKALVDYLTANENDLKALEASSSFDATKNLHLDKLYLDDMVAQ